MNKFVYMTKGNYLAYYPIFYVIETELAFDEVLIFINNEAKKYIEINYVKKNKCINDQYGENFTVKINDREYTFCLGDHNGDVSYEVLFKYHDFIANHKMKINIENIV